MKPRFAKVHTGYYEVWRKSYRLGWVRLINRRRSYWMAYKPDGSPLSLFASRAKATEALDQEETIR